MRKINVSTKNIGRFAGKWVVIDPVKSRIIAVGDSFKDIDPLVTRLANDPRPAGTTPAAFKVPYKDEGPYILVFS